MTRKHITAHTNWQERNSERALRLTASDAMPKSRSAESNASEHAQHDRHIIT